MSIEKRLNILLVNPPRFKGIPVIREERCEITERSSILPPYSLLQIAGILREKGVNVNLIDANGFNLSHQQVADIMKTLDYDALIFRFTPTTFDYDIELAKISKMINPNAKTIGICWTLHNSPKEVLEETSYLDIYIYGEYESVIPELMEALSDGIDLFNISGIGYRSKDEIIVTKNNSSLYSYDNLPLPAYDLLPSLKPYYANTKHATPFTIIYTSKGCPYSCIYCTVANTKWKEKSVDKILEEIKYLKERFNIKAVSFFDETFTLNRKRVIKLCKEFINEKINLIWYCNTRVNLVDKELLKLMYEAGCRGISYGVESGSQEILDNAIKSQTVEQAENAIKWTKEARIKVYCSFILGLPGETWETIKETLDFVKRTLPNGAQFNIAVPYPGTKLYSLALEKGWINPHLNWKELYQHKANMRTEALSTKELEEARKLAYRTLYFNPKWVLSNITWILKEPQDIPLAIKYYTKSIRNYILYGMEDAH